MAWERPRLLLTTIIVRIVLLLIYIVLNNFVAVVVYESCFLLIGVVDSVVQQIVSLRQRDTVAHVQILAILRCKSLILLSVVLEASFIMRSTTSLVSVLSLRDMVPRHIFSQSLVLAVLLTHLADWITILQIHIVRLGLIKILDHLLLVALCTFHHLPIEKLIQFFVLALEVLDYLFELAKLLLHCFGLVSDLLCIVQFLLLFFYDCH